jgi:hypothetical protein
MMQCIAHMPIDWQCASRAVAVFFLCVLCQSGPGEVLYMCVIILDLCVCLLLL